MIFISFARPMLFMYPLRLSLAQTPLCRHLVNTKHPLIWNVDWLKVAAGFWAIVDPNTPSQIMYLNNKAYERLTFILISNEAEVTVLAAPRDTKPSDKEISAPKPETSPPSMRGASAKFWQGMKSSLARSFRAFMEDGKVMFKVTGPSASKQGKSTGEHASKNQSRFLSIVNRWAILLSFWLNFPSSASMLYSDIRRSFRSLINIARTRGALGFCVYLKSSSLFITAYLAGEKRDSRSYGQPVKLTNGLPAWLPANARAGIRSRNRRVIQLWLSLCHVYKVVHVPYDIKKALSTISLPKLVITPKVQMYLDEYRTFLNEFYIPAKT
jgi:hypothetical protein